MRVAIQLYGHLRSFEETYRSLFRNVIEPNRRFGIIFDIFIHTWDEFDSVQKMPAQHNKVRAYAGLKITDLVRDRVAACYAPKAIRIESQISLTNAQSAVVKSNNYNLVHCQVSRNVAHTFCAVNKLRQDYEKANDVSFDLVIITRPDIIFYRPLNLVPFFTKERCWQYFNDDALKSYVFSTYINGVHAVICPDAYVAGLDLLMMAVPSVCDKLARWEESFDSLIDQLPESALIQMMNRSSLRHSYFIYEKDKCWTILRLGAKKQNLIDKAIDGLYFIALPLLLRSRLFCQHAYVNVTTTASMQDFRDYLREHIDASSSAPRQVYRLLRHLYRKIRK